MRKFVYPAVLFYDDAEKQYTAAIFDVEIFVDGKTVEEAVDIAQAYLNKFLELTLSHDFEIPKPTDFEVMIDRYPKNMVVLVESKIDDKNHAI